MLVRFGVMFRRADAAAPRRAEHGRAAHAPARARAHARGVTGDVLHHRIDEAFELRLGDRFHALRGETDREAGDRRLVERRIDHALVAELLLQADRRAEHAAVDADVLAEHDDGIVVLHFVGERLGDGFDEGDLCHSIRPYFVIPAQAGIQLLACVRFRAAGLRRDDGQCAFFSASIAAERCVARSAGTSRIGEIEHRLDRLRLRLQIRVDLGVDARRRTRPSTLPLPSRVHAFMRHQIGLAGASSARASHASLTSASGR